MALTVDPAVQRSPWLRLLSFWNDFRRF